MLTYLELCQRTKRQLGVQGGTITSVQSQTGIDEQIVEWVADGDTEIQVLYEDWDFLRQDVTFNTVGGQSEYTTAAVGITSVGKWDRSSFARLSDPGLNNWKRLAELPYELWQNSDQRYGNNLDEEPVNFTLVRPTENIVLYPTPDTVYPIAATMWTAPVRMTVNTDVSPIPERYQQIIVEAAKVKWAEYEENAVVLARAEHQYFKVFLPRLRAEALRGQAHMWNSDASDQQIMVGGDGYSGGSGSLGGLSEGYL